VAVVGYEWIFVILIIGLVLWLLWRAFWGKAERLAKASAKTTSDRFCVKCGAEISTDSKFCNQCGSSQY